MTAHENLSAGYFRELTWGDLLLWAGKAAVSEGRKCQRNREIKQLAFTKTGGLLAWVEAEELFATRVEYDGIEMVATCSCNPIHNPCGHAVAVIIEYIFCLKREVLIPRARQNDERFFLL